MTLPRPVHVRGVIFDVDGTLVDSNDAHAHAWVRALHEAGHGVAYEDVRRLTGIGGNKLLQRVTGLDSTSDLARLASQRRAEIFRRDYLPLLRALPGARHLVQLMVSRGMKVTVASSALEEEVKALLHVAGVEDLLPNPVSKDEVSRSKPDPESVQVALDRLGLPPEDVVMIGDTPYDIEAATRAGVATIALRCGGWSEQDLADALAVFDDPQDLANQFQSSPLGGRAAA